MPCLDSEIHHLSRILVQIDKLLAVPTHGVHTVLRTLTHQCPTHSRSPGTISQTNAGFHGDVIAPCAALVASQ